MNFSQPIVLAVTGGIACGKSEAGRILSAGGFRVLDTDELAHELMRKGTAVYRQILDTFGNEILSADGEINRAVLGRRVFADPAGLVRLNQLVHPAVIQSAGEWIRARRAEGKDAAVLVPLLFEAGWTDGWDAVLCIAADNESVLRRLAARGLSPDEAKQRVAAQMPLSEKCARADAVIHNNGSLQELQIRIRREVERIRHEQRKQDE